MASTDVFGYVSVIGFNFLEPITILLENLLSEELEVQNSEVKVVPKENGISCVIIIMSVLLIESAISRLKYETKNTLSKGVLEFILKEFPNYQGINQLRELFVIRDAIVHNHIWEAKFIWSDDAEMKLLGAKLWEGSGDKKFRSVVNRRTRRTKLLGLNLFPTRINRQDAFIVLRKTVAFLSFIQQNGTPHISISNQYVLFRGQLRLFIDIVKEI